MQPQQTAISTYFKRQEQRSEQQPSLPDGARWDDIGASDLKAALCSTVLVDAAWLAALADDGGILPRCQDVPEAAKVRLEEMEAWWDKDSETVGVLVVSHPWLDIYHPDPHGEQLQKNAFVFRAFAGSAEQRRGCRVGVFIDYCALPQRRSDGYDDRTEAEHARFGSALLGINAWYGHRRTHVLLVNTALPRFAPSGAPYANTQPYEGRGWCYAESTMSSMAKEACARIELSRLKGDVSKYWPAEKLYLVGASERPPPIAPSAFRQRLGAGIWDGSIKFTNRGDVDIVSSIYERAFLSEMSKAAGLSYSNLQWTDPHVATLATALAYAHEHGALASLTALHLHSNEIGDDGCVALANAALPRTHCLLACLPSSPQAEGRNRPFAQLASLHLHSNRISDPGLYALVEVAERGNAFPSLKELTLSDNTINDEGFAALALAVTSGAFPALEHITLIDNPGSASLVRIALRTREATRAR